MSLAVGCACVALLVAAGWWPMCALGSALVGPAWWERAALATALGAALTGLAQLAASALGAPAGPWVPLGLASVSLAGAGARARRGGPRAVGAGHPVGAGRAGAASGPGARPPLSPWLAALLVATSLVGTGAAVGYPFVADGSRIWAARARDLALDGAVAAPALTDPGREAVHRDYPLLAPALLAPVFGVGPDDAMAGPKLVLAALAVALLGLMASLLAREGARGRLALAVFACLPFLANAEVRESALAGGYVDGVVALFLLLLVIALERACRMPSTWPCVAVAGAAGAALASTKLEGGVELLVVAVASLLLWARRGATLAALGLSVLLAMPTLVIRWGVAQEPAGFEPAWLADPDVLAARAVPLAAALAGLAVDASSFALLPLLLLAWLAGAPAGRGSGREADAASRGRAFALLLLLGMLVLMLLSYLTTTMHASRHVHTSAHRLLWHVLPAVTWLSVRAGGRDWHVSS